MSALALLVASTVLTTCPASRVHYTPYAGTPQGLGRVPWVETSNGSFYGHLFYVGGTPWARTRPARAHIFTTKVKRDINPKVLWLARRGTHRGAFVIRGRRLDGPGAFRWTGGAASGSGDQFPSYVTIPAAGCWRVTVTAGRLSGSVVFAAVDTF